MVATGAISQRVAGSRLLEDTVGKDKVGCAVRCMD